MNKIHYSCVPYSNNIIETKCPFSSEGVPRVGSIACGKCLNHEAINVKKKYVVCNYNKTPCNKLFGDVTNKDSSKFVAVKEPAITF